VSNAFQLRYDYTGYPLSIAVGSEVALSGNVPFLPPTTDVTWVNLTSVGTGPSSIEDDFTEFSLSIGDQIVYNQRTTPDNYPVSVSAAGLVAIDGSASRTNSFTYRVIRANGTWSAASNVFSLDNTPPTITLNGLAIQSVPQNATWTDPGATAVDDNGDILTDQIVVTGTVNTANLGQQILTYSIADAAGNTASVQRRVYVYAVSESYTDARDQVRVLKPNNVVYLHDGLTVPTTQPKDPNSRVFKGFELLGFATDEIVLGYVFLINDTEVGDGDAVDGLTFHGSQANGINKIKAELSGGTVGTTYKLTLRFTTQYTPSDDRSQYFVVQDL
jgi:hypothetical protein